MLVCTSESVGGESPSEEFPVGNLSRYIIPFLQRPKVKVWPSRHNGYIMCALSNFIIKNLSV
jgi:hypothetical protein